jgi:hypothetical protein
VSYRCIAYFRNDPPRGWSCVLLDPPLLDDAVAELVKQTNILCVALSDGVHGFEVVAKRTCPNVLVAELQTWCLTHGGYALPVS